jgi:3-oxoacyl-[acyl-carrier protein] reductase
MTWFEERAGLDGTVAVVTGGAGGLGRAIVEDLAANAVRIALVDIDSDAAALVTARLRSDHRQSIVHVGDVREPNVLPALFDAVDHDWGRVDTLVNVVGGTFRASFADTNQRGWDALLRTNLTHVLHACSLAIPRMRAGGRGGSIINITTIEAHRGAPGFAVYSAAKAAVEQFARSLAVELAPEGIRVNNIAPDVAPTPNMASIDGVAPMSTALAAGISIPMGRVGVPTEVSSCAVFLASKLSSYITGSTLHPDGGTLAASGWWNWSSHGYRIEVPPDLLDLLAPVLHDRP